MRLCKDSQVNRSVGHQDERALAARVRSVNVEPMVNARFCHLHASIIASTLVDAGTHWKLSKEGHAQGVILGIKAEKVLAAILGENFQLSGDGLTGCIHQLYFSDCNDGIEGEDNRLNLLANIPNVSDVNANGT